MYFREIFREHSELLLSLISNQDRQSSFRRSHLTTYNLLQLPVARMTNLARKFASLCLKLGDVGRQKYNSSSTSKHGHSFLLYCRMLRSTNCSIISWSVGKSCERRPRKRWVALRTQISSGKAWNQKLQCVELNIAQTINRFKTCLCKLNTGVASKTTPSQVDRLRQISHSQSERREIRLAKDVFVDRCVRCPTGQHCFSRLLSVLKC